MATIELPISKSIANRELILRYLSGDSRPTFDSDVPDDVRILADAIYSGNKVWDLGHAGTAMRFATALACAGNTDRLLRGSDRMHQRPIGILVDALHSIGADIEYLGKEGFPPLEIKPVQALGGKVSIDGSVSSQYISALLLIAPILDKGIELTLLSTLTSRPYIELTLAVLRSKGIDYEWNGNVIRIEKQDIHPFETCDERDWSAAAFFYGLVAQGYPDSIYFPDLRMESVQGDRELASLYESLGVSTESHFEGVRIYRTPQEDGPFKADLASQPDLAQAIAFTCAAIGKECHLTGLHTLRIKETDRIAAIEECLSAVGCQVQCGDDWIKVKGKARIAETPIFDSYEDHRMAMATSILTPALKSLSIKDETVVSKSFPKFWEVLEGIGVVSLIRT